MASPAAPMPTRRLVLSLYKSLLGIAKQYDKNVPSARNALFLIQKEREGKEKEKEKEKDAQKAAQELVSVLVKEPFKLSKKLTDEKLITVQVHEAFKSLRMLHQFYLPSVAWAPILQKDKKIPFDQVLLTIAKFDSPNADAATLAQQFESISQRVHAIVAQPVKGEAETEGEETPLLKARRVIDAISRVVYFDLGISHSGGKFSPSKEHHVLSSVISSQSGSQQVLACLFLALAQRENVELFATTCNYRTLLRYSKDGNPRLVNYEDDVFVDVTNAGKVLYGVKAATNYCRTGSTSASSAMENFNTAGFITKTLSNLSGYNSKWKEHLTICHELTKAPEPKPAPAESKSKSAQKFKYAVPSIKLDNSEWTPTIVTPAPAKLPAITSALSASSSSASLSSAPSSSSPTSTASPTSTPTPTTLSTSSAPATVSSTPTADPEPTQSTATTSETASSETASSNPFSPTRILSSVFSLLRRKTSPKPSSAKSAPVTQKTKEEENKKDDGEDKAKQTASSPSPASSPSASSTSNSGRKFSRLFPSSESHRNPYRNNPRKF